MGALSGGAWLGIGIAIGFVIGVIVSAVVSIITRRRTHGKPQSQVRQSARGTSSLAFSSLSNEGPAAIHSATNVTTSPKQSVQDAMFYSPLQSCMVKTTNVRGSAASAGHPDPAAYGSHGLAIVQPGASASASLIATQTEPPSNPIGTSEQATAQRLQEPQPDVQDLGHTQADQDTLSRQQPQHQRMFSVADAYGADDLDDEWAVVLGDLDTMLAKSGQPGLASPERAVAVRRLIAVTGSRGMQFALEAALQDVMRHRSKR